MSEGSHHSGSSKKGDELTSPLDPTLLGKDIAPTIHSLTPEQVATLLGKKLTHLKYPVFLQFEHKRFALQNVDFLDALGDCVKQLRPVRALCSLALSFRRPLIVHY